MKAYGAAKRTGSKGGPGHQDCGICHPSTKNKKAKARREAKRAANGVA